MHARPRTDTGMEQRLTPLYLLYMHTTSRCAGVQLVTFQSEIEMMT